MAPYFRSASKVPKTFEGYGIKLNFFKIFVTPWGGLKIQSIVFRKVGPKSPKNNPYP